LLILPFLVGWSMGIWGPGFGKWKAGLCLNPSDLPTVIHKAANNIGKE
jgi:hypothetical protein